MARTRFEASIRRTARVARGLDRTLDLSHGREVVPASWLTPTSDEPVPAVLLLHGFSSSRGRMSQAVGRPLLATGVASLALDLPYHGERSAENGTVPKNPLALVSAWRSAVAEARAAVDWLEEQPEVDPSRMGVVGYSLGGFLALMTAADEPRLQVVALAAAGDLPDQTPYATMVRSVVDPQRAARKLAGRPLLLLNGRRDTTTRPAQAERLFAAAEEPKTLLWYEGGHWPPPAAIEQVVQWVAAELRERARTARTTARGAAPRVRRERPA
jgi:dienelactone hydrolase